MKKLPPVWIEIGVAFALCLAGCGAPDADGLPREPVSGDVLFGGKPLEKGMIQFFASAPGAGMQVGAVVTDGSFSITRELGPVPGDYKVAITASSAAAEKTNMDEGPPERFKLAVEMIPPQYNARTTLTAKVERAGENRFKFDLAAVPFPRGDTTAAKPGGRALSRGRPGKG